MDILGGIEGTLGGIEGTLSFVPQLLPAARVTILLTCVSMAFGLMIGLLVALARIGPYRLLRAAMMIYIEIIRGTPLLVQLVYIYFVLPAAGVAIDAIPAAIAALSLNYGAYMSEVYRAAILSIEKGQMEAALSLGYTSRQALWQIVIPQSLLVAIPSLGGYFIALLKDSSLASVIAVVEILKTTNIIAGQTFRTVEVYTAAALMYLAMSVPISFFVRRLERGMRLHV
jgi:His/Glu/Gln/Arg/opine family amino acid ABC transporter permease subunit